MVLAGFASGEAKNLDSIHSESDAVFGDMPPEAQPRASASEPGSPQMNPKRYALQGNLIVRTDNIGIDLEKVRTLKCVLVGDGAVGKTSLVVSYTTNGYPLQYVPTAFDDYSVMVQVDEEPLCLQICDTAGQDDFDTLRPLCYPKTDVFLVCFSVVSPTSFHNIIEKWIPEIRSHNNKTPIILVGTQCDLRTDVNILIELSRNKENPIAEAEAAELAERINAVSYIECSALTQHNLKDVFDSAILTGLKLTSPPKSGTKSIIRRFSKKENYNLKIVPDKKKSKSKRKPSIWTKLCCIPVPHDPE